MLVQQLDVEQIRPPVAVRSGARSAMVEWTFGFSFSWHKLSSIDG
jgi:hypothetical protein